MSFPHLTGEHHPAARFSEMDVALMRLLAADRSQPKGWIQAYARARGLKSTSAACHAIGGQTWKHITDPKPVRSWRRVRPGPARLQCSRCGKRKDAEGCAAKFHRIDHRQFTSPRNGRRRVA